MTRMILIASLMGTALFGGTAMAASANIQKAIADPARPGDDTKRDAQRHPAELMEFAGIKPGMTVVDLLPGNGYFTRLFAAAVGPGGHVYAYFGPQYDDRLAKAGIDPNNQFADLKAHYANLGTIHGPLAGFVTPEKVDMVWTSDNYHDIHNKQYSADIAGMNKAIFASLKKGGTFIVVDHRAAKGAGAGSTEALHRMDEGIAKREIEAAGFRLVAESKLLTRPSDDNSKKIFETGEHDNTDQMVLEVPQMTRTKLAAGLVAAGLCSLVIPAAAQSVPRIKAVVVGFEGSILTVMPDGEKQSMKIGLRPATRILQEEQKSLSAIQSGDYIGATLTKAPSGLFTAQEVHIFPAALKGSGEGLYPATPGSSHFILNGTVSEAAAALTIKFRGAGGDGAACTGRAPVESENGCQGQVTITVPAAAPVLALTPGNKSLLVPGAVLALSIMAGPDGKPVTPGLTVETVATPPVPLPEAPPAAKPPKKKP